MSVDIINKIIENEYKVSNDRILMEYRYTVVFITKILDENIIDSEENLSLYRYYIPIFKGMLNRCIRHDQSDWKFVYACFEFTLESKISYLVDFIIKIEEVFNYAEILKKDRDSIEIMLQNIRISKDYVKIEKYIKNFNRNITNVIMYKNMQFKLEYTVNNFLQSDYARSQMAPIRYKNLIEIAKDFNQGFEMLESMKVNEIKISQKVYDTVFLLIKEERDLDKLRKLINDDEIFETLSKRSEQVGINEIIINKYKKNSNTSEAERQHSFRVIPDIRGRYTDNKLNDNLIGGEKDENINGTQIKINYSKEIINGLLNKKFYDEIFILCSFWEKKYGEKFIKNVLETKLFKIYLADKSSLINK